MQIESEILTISMVTAFFGPGHYEDASPSDQGLCRKVVMDAYTDACSRQDAKNRRAESDYIQSIITLLRAEQVNTDKVNVLISCLPCERLANPNGSIRNYTGDSKLATEFIERLVGPKYMGHVGATFRTMLANPYVTSPETITLLFVGLSQHSFNLVQPR